MNYGSLLPRLFQGFLFPSWLSTASDAFVFVAILCQLWEAPGNRVSENKGQFSGR